MQGLFKSAVLAAISGCSDRIGYCEMREGSGLVSKAICGSHSNDHVIERYLDVARYLALRQSKLFSRCLICPKRLFLCRKNYRKMSCRVNI